MFFFSQNLTLQRANGHSGILLHATLGTKDIVILTGGAPDMGRSRAVMKPKQKPSQC